MPLLDHLNADKGNSFLRALQETAAFQRLRDIRFLGGIDYLLVHSPNGVQGNVRHTRYQHSIGVARLALLYCSLMRLDTNDRDLIAAAALLHDIGHAPLSHSLEPVFKEVFDLDHHRATKQIITGASPLGADVYAILRAHNLDVERLIALIAGEDRAYGGFFSGPINFDTIEAIIRSYDYARSFPSILRPETVVRAAVRRNDHRDRDTVDRFWQYKDYVYRHIINSRAGVLADYACRLYMRRHIALIEREDYFSTERRMFKELPGLKNLLTSLFFSERLLQEEGRRIVAYQARRFFVDPSRDFFCCDDEGRYKQFKEARYIQLTEGGATACLERSLFEMDAIMRAKDHSEEKLSKLRARLSGVVPAGEVVLTCGSYARREASAQSDMDFFIIVTSEDDVQPDRLPWVNSVKEAISEIVKVEPATGGAFSKVQSKAALLRNIGGDDDTNQNLTRRMLFLLEGEWLFNREAFDCTRRKVLERYIAEGMTDHQMALFLLNDVVRYYRTVAVDYEFKTVEGRDPKPWGIRNIKLVFSRKLLYASGLFSVALTAERTRASKIDALHQLFDLPALDRMARICGQSRMEGTFACYNHFLQKMEDEQIRGRLVALDKDGRADDVVFRGLKNQGHLFTRELVKLFEATFDPTHPIRRAIIF